MADLEQRVLQLSQLYLQVLLLSQKVRLPHLQLRLLVLNGDAQQLNRHQQTDITLPSLAHALMLLTLWC